MDTEFEPVIGLEVHVQLATDSKAFARSRARISEGQNVATELVNGNTNPVCTGHPGTLPVLNQKAVEYAIKAGLALQCTVHEKSVFSRKHYFYPDLPKGYQISQFDKPICERGKLQIELKKGPVKTIGIQRIHMEEDAGKNVHLSGFSLVNFNRSGVPLIEIVSEPDIRTSEEAGAYLRALYAVVTYLGICDGNLQEGNFRCDANVSVRPKGSPTFGTRTEIKNLNSFRYVEKAIDFEIERQIQVIRSGGKITQETRGYDNAQGTTFSMRSKEEAQDYRYFPDPDLPTLVVSTDQIEKIRMSLPELPEQKKNRYVKDFGLSAYDAGVITSTKTMALFYEETLKLLPAAQLQKGAKQAANFLTGELARLLNEANLEIDQSQVKPAHLAAIARAAGDAVVSSTGAKTVLQEVWETGAAVDQIIESKGLKQVSDLSSLEPAIDKVIQENSQQVAEYRSGKEKLLGFFVGQVMKATGGKANPSLLQELVKKKLQ